MAQKKGAARVYGLVQGVSFRYATQKEAKRLALAGWVRNRIDGTVELECEGEAESVNALHEWLKHGPALARVDKLEWRDDDNFSQNVPENLDFQILPTI